MIGLPAYKLIFLYLVLKIHTDANVKCLESLNILVSLGLYVFVLTFSLCLKYQEVLLGNASVFKSDLDAN